MKVKLYVKMHITKRTLIMSFKLTISKVSYLDLGTRQ